MWKSPLGTQEMDERGQVASGIERRMNRAYFQSIKIENLQDLVAHMCAQASLVTVLTKIGDKHFSFFLWRFWTKGIFLYAIGYCIYQGSVSKNFLNIFLCFLTVFYR